MEQKYNSEKNDLTLLYQLSSCLRTLTGGSSMLFNSCLSLAKSWDTVSSNFKELIESEDIDVRSNCLVELLEAAKLDWEDLLSEIG
ncbi:hypothetical protein [Brevibacillus laterosporus]|uniref:hypothetical protein n=1 Tax=Brevibacillus laterosporus TaxID=1465 RepID=UPI00264C2810|nr:hypothetical protein [Brevibacillus laterosporus]MDN9011209.1 hypothetical protein [Brevibacillus laterosporus]MDO0942232.1 hypothetical protein [Brevibacillus laterosporus]